MCLWLEAHLRMNWHKLEQLSLPGSSIVELCMAEGMVVRQSVYSLARIIFNIPQKDFEIQSGEAWLNLCTSHVWWKN